MLRPLSFTLSARKTERGAIEQERFDFAKPTSLSRQRGAGSTAFMSSLVLLSLRLTRSVHRRANE